MPKDPPYTDPHMKSRARELRRNSTIPERILWGMLRNRNLAGLKFRRQHVIGPYVVDYLCHDAHLVVELDGMSHVGQAEQDFKRTQYLEKQGYRVFRVTNDDVLQTPDAVADAIVQAASMVEGAQAEPSP